MSRTGSSTKDITIATLLVVLLLCCFTLSPKLHAVTPAPDGGYPGGNTAEGIQALQSLTTGAFNTAIGQQALFSNTSGSFNTAEGFRALVHNTTGPFNTAVGTNALYSATTGQRNVADGFGALFRATTASGNVAIGSTSLYNNVIGVGNAAIGDNTLFNNTASFNLAAGSNALFSNTTGTGNVGVGVVALHDNTTGSNNTATGNGALRSNTTGGSNTAIGSQALGSSTNSPENVAVGFRALAGTSGTNGFNVAVGFQALDQVTTGGQNTAVGDNALGNLVTGTLNTALGDLAGSGHTGGDTGNVDIGGFVFGVSGESNVTRIRNIGNTAQSSGIFVTVESIGGTKLGYQSSSARYKEKIKPMGEASETLFALKPVIFRYKADMDPAQVQQYGLIAEEVAKVNPDLVVSDPDGRPATLRFLSIQAMLLNEFLKEHRKVEQQEATIKDLKSLVAQQQTEMATVLARLKEQESRIEKVSTQVELHRAAPRTVANVR
jgi:hypothetical protein